MKKTLHLITLICCTTSLYAQTTTLPANTKVVPVVTQPANTKPLKNTTVIASQQKTTTAQVAKKDIEIKVKNITMRQDAGSVVKRYRTAEVVFEISNFTLTDRDLSREPINLFFREMPDTSFYPPFLTSLYNLSTDVIVKSGETQTVSVRYDVTRPLLGDRKYLFYIEVGYPAFLKKESTTGLVASAEPVYVTR